MSAAETLKQARAAGIRVGIDGNDLTLEASAPPLAEVHDLLARHKAEILIMLRPGDDGWNGEEWQEFFEDRARVASLNGRLQRNHAEDRAFLWCVNEWLNRNPSKSPPGRCHHCGQSQGVLLPYLTSQVLMAPAHTWLHQECSTAWHTERRLRAMKALSSYGIHDRGHPRNEEGRDHE